MNIEAVVYKYSFSDCSDELVVDLFPDDIVIHADFQKDVPCIWVQTYTGGGEQVKRKFIIRGTGQKFPWRRYKHISTCLVADGDLVFHFFEEATNG